jgi:hypothetical protein
MKIIKTFEEFISEAEALKAEDSKVYVEDVTLEDGTVIKAAETLGAIAASATEKEFEDYFFNTYGQDAFKTEEMSKLKTYFNEMKEEENKEKQEEEDAEKKKEEGGDAGAADAEAGLEEL